MNFEAEDESFDNSAEGDEDSKETHSSFIVSSIEKVTPSYRITNLNLYSHSPIVIFILESLKS
jgi:hypothetical protein